MIPICPDCQQLLIYKNLTDAYCQHCHQFYRLSVDCPDCHKAITRLQGCGATDYFCQYGHGLISKKRLTMTYQQITSLTD